MQQANFGRLLECSEDALHGYRIVQIEIHDPAVVETSGVEIHSALVPADGPTDPIRGMVFELTPAELAQADIYESASYRRVEVKLASGRPAWVYVKA